MVTKRRLKVALASLALVASTSLSGLEFQPCTLTGSAGNGTLQALCASWQQPLNPEDPTGPSVDLRIAKLASTAINPAKDAFTLINGGPGGSSIDLLVDLAPIAASMTRERDVIVIDQRGTGRSSPLRCPGLSDTTESLPSDQTQALTKQCLAALPHDPRYFTSSVAVRDLEALRQALGYEQWSLYGVSYGTRVVLHYLRRYPEQVRSAVIDGVVPPTQSLGGDIALNSQASLEAVFTRCETDEHCQARFPELRESFKQVAAQLKSGAVPLQLPHPVTGEPTELLFSYHHLAIWLRLALYAPETTALIPLVIDQAHHLGRYTPIAAAALQSIYQLTQSLNYGMHNAVVCSEDAPFYSSSNYSVAELEETYMGADMYQMLQSLCTVWPSGFTDADIKTEVSSDVPTLVLSGEFDPITPPAYGNRAAEGLTRSHHIVAPGQGHGVIARGCMPRVIRDFVESASPEELDASCVDHLSAFPFFITPMGPVP